MIFKKIIKLSFYLLLFCLATPALAYVMSSTNYQIERDSINFGGGLSTSSSYTNESTLGEIGTGYLTSASYVVKAGYQQMESSWISLSVPPNASLKPDINASMGGLASTSVDLLINTNNGSGYTMQMKAGTNPALKGATFDFDNYTIAGGTPDYAWSVDSAVAEFGFTPEGNNIINRYRDNGISCNQPAGFDSSDTCWDAPTTTYATIAQSIAPNYPTGTVTTLKFRAEAGSTSLIDIGSYLADMIITAYTN